jgi:sulfur carrier protein
MSGMEHVFRERMTVAAMLEHDAIDPRGIAVAVNDRVIRKSIWQEHELQDGDRVEIVRAVQGG